MQIAFLLYDGSPRSPRRRPYEVLSRIPVAQVQFVGLEPAPR